MTRLLWLLVAIILLLTNEAVRGHRYSLADILEDEFFDEPEEEFPYKNLRLPGNIVPSEYELYLHPNITDGHFKYYGDIKIHFNVRNATDSIILHSEKLTHTYARVYEDAPHKTEIGIRKVLTNPKLDFVLLRLDRELAENERCVLHVRFNSVLKAGLKGFYRSSYKTKSGKTKFLATTQFEATGARMAFPCFDEPAMKAKFSIRIVREKIHTALSNMPIERTIERNDGLLMDFFEKSVKMSTYLVAFVVCEFAHINTTSSNGVKVRVWAPKDLISQAKYALQVAPKVLDYYEKFFKAKFPLPKQDMIAIPDFAAGAMENWGLITYRTTDLLIDEVHSSVKNKERVVQTIAHELAHQWFGNLVTMKWWNDLWLNEGFARFVENIGINAFSTSWDIFDFFVPHYLQSALALDSKLNSHPISVVVTDPNSIGGLFDTISYSKGASIIRMMSDFLGEKIFTDGLAAYLQKHKYGNAESDDLWEALSAAADNKVDVRTIMNTWIKKMGYPVLNVAHDPIKNIATLKQERFVTDISNDIPSYKWEVPVTYYFQNDKAKKRSWMHVNDDSVNIAWAKSDGWLKLNANNTGFYRVNYDLQNWRALIDQLKNDHTVLYPSDRANLIDDAFALAKTGRLSYETALDLSEYLLKETNYTPMYRALLSLGHVEKFLRGRPSHRIFKKYLINLYTPLAKKLGWKNEGTNLEKMLRPLVLSKLVYYGDKNAVDNALKYYKGWMNGEGIPADLQSVVYLAGSKYGGEAEWQFMFEKFSTTMYPSEKSRLMASLAYTSVPSILKNYLMNTINSNIIRSQDTCSIIGLIAANPLGKKMAQAFVKYQWPLLYKRYESKTALLRLFPSVFGGKTPEDLKEARHFFQTHKLGSGKLAAKRTLASIQVGIHWLANNEKQVENWLKKKIL